MTQVVACLARSRRFSPATRCLAFPAQNTAAYAVGALLTDSWLYGGIGGCGAQQVATSLAKSTTLYFYQFDDPNPPASSGGPPGFQYGADHGSELPFLWPSVSTAQSQAAEFTPAEQELSRQMVAYWGAFAKSGSPNAPGQPTWPAYSSTAKMMSLRPGHQTQTITASTYSTEHQCTFWNQQPQPKN